MMIRSYAAAALSVFSLLAVGTASAGSFANITIDGDFSDWAGIPVLDNDGADNVGNIDISSIQIANDDDFLYLRVSFHQPITVNPTIDGSVFIAIDNDSNTSTGFDIFSLGLVGSEVGWQNDFPFEQSTVSFNAGGVTGGAAIISPLFNSAADASVTTSEREYALSRAATFSGSGSSIFPNGNISVLFWADVGAGDVSSAIPYTFAPNPIPEPSTATMMLLGLVGLAAASRRSA